MIFIFIPFHPIRDMYIAFNRRLNAFAQNGQPLSIFEERIMAKAKGEGNKAQMVRDAVAALGDDAKPQAIQAWISEKHKVELTTTMISSYKSNMKKSGGKKAGRGRSSSGGGKGGDIFGDISTVQGLLAKHGKPNLSKLIDALS